MNKIEVDIRFTGTKGASASIDFKPMRGSTEVNVGGVNLGTPSGTDEYTRSMNITADDIDGMRVYGDNVGGSGYIYLRRLRVYYDVVTGHPEDGTFLVESSNMGDALFKIVEGVPTAWGGAGGIQFNGANVSLANVSPSAYNPSHIYSFIATGIDDNFTFNFADTDGSYTENSGSLQVTIEQVL